MKVLLFNGSPHPKGCTYTALSLIAETLEQHEIETEILQIKPPIRGCMGCKACVKLGKCAYGEDGINQALAKCKEADGFVIGSPVHYAAASGQVTSFLDRLFYAAGRDVFAFKPGAAIVTLRRGGATAALDQLQKYFTISNMPIVPSHYWNMVHGNTPEELLGDPEGLQVMRALGENMAWLLSCIAAGRQAGILPKPLEKIRTNFIR